jgi:hypothetical protein
MFPSDDPPPARARALVEKRQPGYDRLGELENRIVQMQLDALHKSISDHEQRLRLLEDTATKFNFLLYLTMGGGLLSLVNLLALVFIIVRSLQP